MQKRVGLLFVSLFCSLFLFTSCLFHSSQTISFLVGNESTQSLFSVSIYPCHDAQLLKSVSRLDAGDTVLLKLDMRHATKSDGDYVLHFTAEQIEHISHFGYFTNGFPLERMLDIRIEADYTLSITVVN